QPGSGRHVQAVGGMGAAAGYYFFFQAEDGIRDRNVTGVQTCALPILSFFHGFIPLQGYLNVLFSGFTSNTGVEEVDELLTRGGIEDMFFTITLVLLALSLGGLLFTLGIVPKLLSTVEKALKKVSSVVFASALTAIGINFLIGEQYLSVLLTGEAYSAQYKKVGLHNINLARVSEDAGTVVNPLVPWSVCGVFITSVLGVSTMAYVPFTFFCLLSP